MTWFFTDLDPRAKIAGSRDPLGFQQPWTALGREFVATLTTVTVSVRGFTTLMLGLHLADELIRDGEPEEHRARFFLEFEQVAGYARHLSHGVSSLGTQRIRKRLSQSSTVPLGLGSDAAILSDQRTYGLWGLYSSSARASGLVDRNEQRPTKRARDHLREVVLPRAHAVHPKLWSDLLRLIRPEKGDLYTKGRHRDVVSSLGEALSPELLETEREFYLQTLVENDLGDDPTHGRQRLLWHLMEDLSKEFPWDKGPTRSEVEELAKRAAETDEGLADSLQAVLVLDPFFALVSRLFSLALQASGTRAEVIATIRGQRAAFGAIDPAALESRRSRLGGDQADRLVALGHALRDGDFERSLDLILEQNSSVMRARGGSAWAESRGDRIEVRLRSEPLIAPAEADVNADLFYPYFLSSLKTVGGAVRTGKET